MNIDPPSSCSKGAKGFFLARRFCSRCCRSGVGTWRRYWTLMFLLRKEKWGASSAPTSKEGRSIKGILSVARAVLTPRESSPPPPRAVSLELPSWKSHEEIGEHLPRGLSPFPPSANLRFYPLRTRGKGSSGVVAKGSVSGPGRSLVRVRGKRLFSGLCDITPTSCNGRWKDAKTLKAFFFFFSRHPRLSKDWCTRVDNMFLLFREK